MESFKERRGIILGQFAKAKEDLEQLNLEIDEQVAANDQKIASLMNENKELCDLHSANVGSIKTFLKFLK